LRYSWLALTVLALAGCGSKQSTPVDRSQFQSLVTLYSSLIKWGSPPKNEADFKAAFSGKLKPVIDALKLTDLEGIFTGRDGKPVVVIYGPRPANMKADLVAYEQDGVDGKRLVGSSLGIVEEVDEQRFREIVPTPAK
jgi:hypothetical protein